jgi:hypothetical protein
MELPSLLMGCSTLDHEKFVPMQIPPLQTSVWVQALPSLQAVPSGPAGFEHAPVAASVASSQPGCSVFRHDCNPARAQHVCNVPLEEAVPDLI